MILALCAIAQHLGHNTMTNASFIHTVLAMVIFDHIPQT